MPGISQPTGPRVTVSYACWCARTLPTFEERQEHADRAGCRDQFGATKERTPAKHENAAWAILRNPHKFPAGKVAWARRVLAGID
jgi:hypothetical protein